MSERIMTPLLQVENLRVRLPGPNGPITIVDGVDLQVDEGQVFGIAGESGSGKTMTALALLRLLPPRAEVTGRILFRGRDLVTASTKDIQAVRGSQISMVFQDPMTSLHPMLTVGKILTAPVRHHDGISRSEAKARAIQALEQVRIPDPEGSLTSYPHQFSGGMRQRIAIAAALICRPTLLIADEPTTALDVTVQAGIMDLLDRLRAETGLSVMLITHDLGVMSVMADMLTVMYAGRVVESGETSAVLREPQHPYTAGLLAALPQPEVDGVRSPLVPIPGMPPSLTALPPGCAFEPRCPLAVDSCRTAVPPLLTIGARKVACPITTAAQGASNNGGEQV